MKLFHEHIKGASSLVASAAIYASFGLLIRQMAEMFGTNTQVAVRLGLAAVIVGIMQLIVRRSLKLNREQLIKVIVLGVLSALVVLLFTVSVLHTKVANSVFLLYAGSIIVSLLLGRYAFKETLTPGKLLAIALALAGLAMYSQAILAVSIGVVTGLLSGLCDGAANALRKGLSDVPRNTVLLYQFTICTVVSGIAIGVSGEQAVRAVEVWPVVATIVFAILQVFLGNLLLYGFQHFDVNVGTIILSLELVFATVLGYVFYRKRRVRMSLSAAC